MCRYFAIAFLAVAAYALSGVTITSRVEADPLAATPPLDAKETAKAKFAALHADPKELAKLRLEVARGIFDARQREFMAGRGTLEFLLRDSERCLEAELALA